MTLSSLTIAANAYFNITNNEIILNYGSGSDPIATIQSYIISAYANGYWDGPGIASSQLYSGSNYGLGYADGADGIVSGLTSGQIEVKWTLLGDANLDGVVNGSDFSILAANFGLGSTNWDQGNFFYGGSVNGTDFAALASNFGQGDSNTADVTPADFAALDAFAAANGLLADVPEPATAAILTLAGFAALRRRRAPQCPP